MVLGLGCEKRTGGVVLELRRTCVCGGGFQRTLEAK